MTALSVNADTIPSDHERRSDHLRRLLAIVDSTLTQLCSLPSLTEDDELRMSEPLEISPVVKMSKEDVAVARAADVIYEPNNFQLQWGHFQDESVHDIPAPAAVSESTDVGNRISFDWDVPSPTHTKRCLVCDDKESCSEVHAETAIAETANKGVSTDYHPPVVEDQRTLEEIDNVVHAILTSLSSSKPLETETKKSPRRKASVPEPRPGLTHSTRKSSSPKPNRSKMPTPKQSAKPSKSPRPLFLARAAPLSSPTTSSTFRESSISTRTSPICALAPSWRETRSMRDTHVKNAFPLRDALPVKEARSSREPFASRRGNSFSEKAKKGGKPSLVMEPLMTVVRQIADTSNVADPDDVMLVVTKKDAPASSTSSVVCIQLMRKDTQNLRSVLSTLLAENHLVDVGTMTDDPPPAPPDKPSATPKVRSVRDLGVGAGDCVVVVRPGLNPSSATSKQTISLEATPSTFVTVRTKRPTPRHERSARLTASCATMAHGATAQRLRRRRRWNRLRSQRQQTRSALRRNILFTLCLSMLSLTFGSLSFSIVCEPLE